MSPGISGAIWFDSLPLPTLVADGTTNWRYRPQSCTGDGTITLFDFDDCCYSWFVNDLAIVVFYALSWGQIGDRHAYAASFWRHFWQGYRLEHDLDRQWLAEIPWFLALREIDTYAVIHRSMDVDAIDDPWAARFMKGRRHRINAGVPYVDLDFSVV